MFGQQKPQVTLTQAEKQDAYNTIVAYLMKTLNTPLTARFQPVEETHIEARQWSPVVFRRSHVFTTVYVEIEVDAQNPFGAMLRRRFSCNIESDSKAKPGNKEINCVQHEGRW